MFCRNCGNELKNGEERCDKCGYVPTKKIVSENYKNNISAMENNKDSMESKINNSQSENYVYRKKYRILIKIALYVLAIVVVSMSFETSNTLNRAAINMMDLRSVSGKTVDEAFYQYYGTFVNGLDNFVKMVGITCGVIIAYIGMKTNPEKEAK